MTPERPILRYYGGKWRIAPWIIDHFPPHRIYCEPFGGGASVLLKKERSYGEIYNDLDGEVVNVFRVMQKNHDKLRRLLRVTPYARDEMELAYERTWNKVERARRAIIRSFMGFGADSVTRDCRTGFRNNSNRSGTTPAHDWANWPDQIDAFHQRLTGVVIENRNAIEVMKSQDSVNTLFYVDPPYIHESRADFRARHGYRCEMTNADHEHLAEYLSQVEGMVVLSGYDHPIYANLGWAHEKIETKVFHRLGEYNPRMEMLWMNPAAIAAQPQMSFL